MSSTGKHLAELAKPVVKRDVNTILARIREFLILRGFTPNQRHEFEWSRRTLPQPLLPGGFAHKLNKNYYFERDARRQVGQPQVLYSTSATNPMLSSAVQPQLAAGTAAPGTAAAAPVTAAATSSSPFVTITEAEKQTAALLAEASKSNIKRKANTRTPGKLYNWDG